jgi:protein subunit release factor A
MKQIEQEHKNREKNLQLFKSQLQDKQDMELQREERLKRQQEVAEVAASELKDSNMVTFAGKNVEKMETIAFGA